MMISIVNPGHRGFLSSVDCLLPFVFLLSAFGLLPSAVQAQTIADRTVATVTNGSRATPDLITYSDLVWQLALEPARSEEHTSELQSQR